MAISLNEVSLIGNLGGDPKVIANSSNGKVISFSVATSESWKDRQTQDWKTNTEWHAILVYGPAAEYAEKHLKKGSKVFIKGSLRTRSFTNAKGDQKVTEVVVKQHGGTIIPLEASRQGSDNAPPASAASGHEGSHLPTNGGWNPEMLDAEIPF